MPPETPRLFDPANRSSAAVAPGGLSRRAMMGGTIGTVAAALARNAARAADVPGEIWDAHTHLAGVTGSAEERIDQLLEYADRLGIRRLVVFLGTIGSHHPDPDAVRQRNDETLKAIARAPDRVLGFVYLDPRHGDKSLDEFDRCVRDGPMVGVKLWVSMRCNEPALDPIVRRAAELKAPLLQHTFFRRGENLPGESDPLEMATLAARHPDALLICGHSGADWEIGLRAIRGSPNIWADTSGFDPCAGMVEMAVRELGTQRVLFGSDAGGRSFASQLAKVESADLPEPAREMVLGGNLRRLLRPIMEAKGLKL